MRVSYAITGLLAALTTLVAAAPTKDEGFIGRIPNSQGHNATAGKEMIVLWARDGTAEKDMATSIAKAGLEEKDIKERWVNNGFLGIRAVIGDHCIDALTAMAEVAYVEEPVEIKTFAQKPDSPWGLQHLSNEAGASGSPRGQDFVYTFDDESLGAGVDIYIVDTGVRLTHRVFDGRIDLDEGFSFTGSVADGDGHGTHVAGTAAGTKFGVAQGANIIAVKVLGDNGSGSSSDTISGMDWIINRHNQRKNDEGFKGSIMSMSWGLSGISQSVDEVVLAAVGQGIHVVVAAGNDNADACLSTPSHNGGGNSAVVSVGSINIDSEISSFSNIGPCVDIYAPGEDILSSWSTADDVINFLSGTSMACPHVSGVLAYLLGQEDPNSEDNLILNPEALKSKLLGMARQGAISGNTGGGSDLLLSNGANGGLTKRVMSRLVVPGGSPASRARDTVVNVDKRFALHSETSQLRF
jgi:cerevisin